MEFYNGYNDKKHGDIDYLDQQSVLEGLWSLLERDRDQTHQTLVGEEEPDSCEYVEFRPEGADGDYKTVGCNGVDLRRGLYEVDGERVPAWFLTLNDVDGNDPTRLTVARTIDADGSSSYGVLFGHMDTKPDDGDTLYGRSVASDEYSNDGLGNLSRSMHIQRARKEYGMCLDVVNLGEPTAVTIPDGKDGLVFSADTVYVNLEGRDDMVPLDHGLQNPYVRFEFVSGEVGLNGEVGDDGVRVNEVLFVPSSPTVALEGLNGNDNWRWLAVYVRSFNLSEITSGTIKKPEYEFLTEANPADVARVISEITGYKV